MDRRSFVKAVAATAAGAAVGAGRIPLWASDAAMGRSLERIGVQLYTVRSLLAEDFSGTLEAVSAAGYQEVEFAGYFDHSPEEVRAILDHCGLEAPSAHVPLEVLQENLGGVIEAAKTVGHRHLVCPWLAPEDRLSIARYKELSRFWNEVGKACRDAGLRFGYHNHDFEFLEVDGQIPFDVILAETDPELVEIELDLFWITKGGQDPLDYFERHPGRFPLCHVKDMGAEQAMVDVGAGHIDFARIFAKSEQAGLEHYFVEHDQPADPLASIASSHAYLKALRF